MIKRAGEWYARLECTGDDNLLNGEPFGPDDDRNLENNDLICIGGDNVGVTLRFLTRSVP
jgi:hypothetical protein